MLHCLKIKFLIKEKCVSVQSHGLKHSIEIHINAVT